MSHPNRADVIRSYFAAFRSGDRRHMEQALAEDFTFTSPYDDRIDKAAYFERCWPNRDFIREHIIERIFEQGEEALVRYRCLTRDGKEFRNAEFFAFENGRLKEVQVFFGAGHQDGRLISQAS